MENTSRWPLALVASIVLWSCTPGEANNGIADSGPDAGPPSGEVPAVGQCNPPGGALCPRGSAWDARYGLSAGELQEQINTHSKDGYRVSHVAGYSVDGQARFAATWEQCDSPEWSVQYGLTAGEFQDALATFTDDGYRLVDISGYEVGGTNFYAAIWEQGSTAPWQAVYGLTSTDLQRAFDTFVPQGYRVSRLNSYSRGGAARHAVIFELCDTPDWDARYGLSALEFQETGDALVAEGFRPVQMTVYSTESGERYSALFDRSTGPTWKARFGLGADDFQQVLDDLAQEGYRLQDVSSHQGLFAGIWTR